MTALQIFTFPHILSGFNHTIQYRSTTTRGNADFLSRFAMVEIHDTTQNDIAESAASSSIERSSGKNSTGCHKLCVKRQTDIIPRPTVKKFMLVILRIMMNI